MIRVQGLFAGKEERKEWAVQTDGVLPRIIGQQGKWRKIGKVVQSQGGRTLQDKSSPKDSSKQPWGGMEGGRISCITTLASPSSGKHTLCNKENTLSSPTTACSKLEAKAFKFLFFEEQLLRSAILKHLSGRQLSRQERIKLRSKAHFSFLRQDSCGVGFDEDIAVIEIPQEERVEVTIEELVEGVRQTYLQLGVGVKGRDVLLSGLHRRIAQVAAGLLAKGDRPIIEPHLPSSCDGQQLLRNYLRRYVGESERMNHCLSESKSKARMMGFYQQIYNRYESIPFSDSPESQSPSLHSIIQPNALLMQSPASSLSKGKSSLNNQESFIKLRFYNNLRKEVLTLSEDTEKIMQEESSKMAHS